MKWLYGDIKTGPIELLVVQSTPFCNLDCKYCYLPDRANTSRMPLFILEKTMQRLLSDSLIKEELTIVWHAGEPLVPGIKYYEDCIELIKKMKPSNTKINFSIQTNGVLISHEWCNFFKENNIKVGVSVDGPAFIHNKVRLNRTGNGTHELVQIGIDLLNQNGIDFHTISVLTNFSLQHSKAIFQYLLDNNVTRCGFNIEEIENINQSSSLSRIKGKKEVKEFFELMWSYNKQNNYILNIRELDRSVGVIRNWKKGNKHWLSNGQQNLPYQIITVDYRGNFSTYSPELNGVLIDGNDSFNLGNVLNTSFEDATKTKKFQRQYREIRSGIKLCSKTCEYYQLCGGGAPSNKYFENGTFSSTETMYCRLQTQASIDATINRLESEVQM